MWALQVNTESEKDCRVYLPGPTIYASPIQGTEEQDATLLMGSIIGRGTFTTPDLPICLFLDEIPCGPENPELARSFARHHADRVMKIFQRSHRENGNPKRLTIWLAWFDPDHVSEMTKRYHQKVDQTTLSC